MTDEVRHVVERYGLALATMERLIDAHKLLGLEYASPDLREAAREVAELNARALEFVERP